MINYSRINFQKFPAITTPLDDVNLNKMDEAIYDLDQGLGDSTDASNVTGNTVFAKIGTLYTSITTLSSSVTNKVKLNGNSVSTVNFSVSDSTLTITTTS